ncbi:IS66 family transposase [Burkholderia sp. Z1]|uniref:IS66 family transposase n=1 Tax=Burkholderia sp. Z1 TaxID=2759039 RepID=UPI001865C8EC
MRKSPITTEALERIGALYQVEAQIRGKPPEERRRIRQTHAVPLLNSLKQWFEATPLSPSGKSDTVKAIQYALNR